MKDYSKSSWQQKKVPLNKVKVKRKPIDWKKYLRHLRPIVLGVSALTLFSGVGYFGYQALGSATFCRLKNIDVSNTKRITRDEVLALASLKPGDDILRMNLKTMGEQISRNPWVETVHIRRYYPDTLALTISEREPLAVVSMGLMYYLDAKGVIFKVLSQGDKLDYPVVTGFTEDEMTNEPANAKIALKETCGLLDDLQKKGMFILADLSEIHYDKGYGFTLFTSSGALPIKMGTGNYAEKLERFARIYPDIVKNKALLQYVDLDYNDKIVVKKS